MGKAEVCVGLLLMALMATLSSATSVIHITPVNALNASQGYAVSITTNGFGLGYGNSVIVNASGANSITVNGVSSSNTVYTFTAANSPVVNANLSVGCGQTKAYVNGSISVGATGPGCLNYHVSEQLNNSQSFEYQNTPENVLINLSVAPAPPTPKVNKHFNIVPSWTNNTIIDNSSLNFSVDVNKIPELGLHENLTWPNNVVNSTIGLAIFASKPVQGARIFLQSGQNWTDNVTNTVITAENLSQFALNYPVILKRMQQKNLNDCQKNLTSNGTTYCLEHRNQTAPTLLMPVPAPLINLCGEQVLLDHNLTENVSTCLVNFVNSTNYNNETAHRSLAFAETNTIPTLQSELSGYQHGQSSGDNTLTYVGLFTGIIMFLVGILYAIKVHRRG